MNRGSWEEELGSELVKGTQRASENVRIMVRKTLEAILGRSDWSRFKNI